MDKHSSFDQWAAPLYSVQFAQRIEEMKQDKYKKINP
jgi:hypothetical protein